MASIRPTLRSDLIARLDDVQMSEADRERAKALMRRAEDFAELAAGIEAFIRHAATAMTNRLTLWMSRARAARSVS